MIVTVTREGFRSSIKCGLFRELLVFCWGGHFLESKDASDSFLAVMTGKTFFF